jgi:hypothetical protein
MTALFHTRATAMSRPGHRTAGTPLIAHQPFTEAAKANHARRLRAQLERFGNG